MKDLETQKGRLLYFAKTKGLSQNACADRLGVSRGTLSNANDFLSRNMLAKAQVAFPDLSMPWLLSNSGNMCVGDNNTQNIDIDLSTHTEKQDSHDTYTASGSGSIAGRNVVFTKEQEDEAARLRIELHKAHEKIRQLQDELLQLYRSRA